MRKTILLLAIILLPAFAMAQEETSQPQPRTTSEIMLELRTQIGELEHISDERAKAIESDKATIDELTQRVASISDSIDATISDLSKANETIITQSEKIRSQRSALAALSAFLGVLFLAHIVVLFLKVKLNITLPYWLNTIL